MADSDNNHHGPRAEPEPGKGYELSGKIMLSAIVVLFVVVVFMVGLHLYARWYVVRLRRRQSDSRRGQRRISRSQIVMYIDSRLPGGAAAADRGLDRAVLNSLPVFLYSPEDWATYFSPLWFLVWFVRLFQPMYIKVKAR